MPTRYVSGFSPSDDSRLAGHYVVRESDAHAWIEVHLPGRGWVEVDPTPPSQLADFRVRSAKGPLLRRRLGQGPKKRSALRREEEGNVAPEIARLLADLDAAWVRRGCPRPSHCAPLEHLHAIPEAIFPASARPASERAVRCFYAARFGGKSVPPAEVREIRAEMDLAQGLSARRDS